MPAYVRALVSTYKSTELAIDRITNTVYFKNTEDFPLPTDWTALAQDIANLFATYRTLPAGFDRVNVRCYSMEDPVPREIRGEHTQTVAAGQIGSNVGPREVALCLSFYADRNLPRNRGRIYIGPWEQTKMQERPAASTGTDPLTSLSLLHQGLQDIGATNIQWCVYSPRTSTDLSVAFKKVTAGWQDNEWDTQRSRGLRPTARYAWEGEG